ncbi:MAG: hypothetical protein HYZ53_26145 [Planctomycetes bacterium]|nr:hypothetical protein [Planctomycetota bacterium]
MKEFALPTILALLGTAGTMLMGQESVRSRLGAADGVAPATVQRDTEGPAAGPAAADENCEECKVKAAAKAARLAPAPAPAPESLDTRPPARPQARPTAQGPDPASTARPPVQAAEEFGRCDPGCLRLPVRGRSFPPYRCQGGPPQDADWGCGRLLR